MATVSGVSTWKARGVHEMRWVGLKAATSVGSWLSLPMLPDKTVEAFGTFTAAGKFQIEGATATGASGRVLNDPVGSPLTITGSKAAQIMENPYKIRPRVTISGGALAVTVVITSQGARR